MKLYRKFFYSIGSKFILILLRDGSDFVIFNLTINFYVKSWRYFVRRKSFDFFLVCGAVIFSYIPNWWTFICISVSLNSNFVPIDNRYRRFWNRLFFYLFIRTIYFDNSPSPKVKCWFSLRDTRSWSSTWLPPR